MKPLLEVADLHVRIGTSHILQGVAFTVAPQGVTAVLGRNGAGKTTTLKAVLGLVPKTGTVRLDGQDITGLPTHLIIRRGLGYAPEDRNVFAGLTVTENLRLAERGRGPHRYDQVYEMFPELKQRGAQRAGTLSGGQQQMVAIGRTLLNDNRMLLVDEPTKGLAPRIVTEVADVLERASHDVPILLVEQNLALVRRIADHVVVIEQGSVVHTGDADSLLTDPELTRDLLGVA
ncbi:branched-chain amino acid transport system ATP-binding protein [Streptosporangium album]|uniref:Branched-chain amino acid transport system ATP-binding protein n=1 Tax=Streptosporangium album TaxID=47479 RepID=A0A7W7WC58_9ACTN|nr:ABC transporter ATP-binding protein [Streptosporangium album]MBB4940980.1 branched-chain amino acid transport system ATP-binding protein [Streptosporangium album]